MFDSGNETAHLSSKLPQTQYNRHHSHSPLAWQAHIAARTVRHFLQRSLKPDAPEDVVAFERHAWSLPEADPLFVFCVSDAEIEIYKEILALYFPR